jgi:hypothetical protein
MRPQRLDVGEVQQQMQQRAVAHEDFGRFDHPLADVLEPGREHPDPKAPDNKST